RGGNEVLRIPPVVVQAIDTTGAGDMYAAGLLYGITHDLSLRESGALASELAAKVVANLGPRLPCIDRQSLTSVAI
ncbi:MAG TPA: PfkB family carbohydrate kinase, partial [Chthonomonadales bacterium]|nr:PfkB family carbohydrate kinase [Chthonomonadales bacterium]